MELNFRQISDLNEALTELQNKTLPFKLSLIIAKDMAILAKETEFYIEQERKFAMDYLQRNEDGTFVQEGEGIFKIIEGKEEECRAAREELDKFTSEVELRKIPISLVEDMELTPKQVGALEIIIEEE